MKLIEAAQAKDLDAVVRLIREGADINGRDRNCCTALYYASENGLLEICQTLLENKANPNICNYNDSSPLHTASYYCREDAVLLLLKKGADLNIKNVYQNTPLHEASYKGNEEIVSHLVAYGAKVNEVGSENRTALHFACEFNGKVELVRILLKNGADVIAVNGKGQTPLDVARSKDRGEIMDLLEQYLLIKPIVQSCTKTFKKLFRGNNSSCNETSKVDQVYLATERGQTETVLALIKGGFDPNTEVDGESLLHIAAKKDNEDLVSLLLQKVADTNAKNKRGYGALHYAAANGNETILKLLVKYKGDVNSDTIEKDTPLHLACLNGHVHIVKILLQNGANINALNEHGNSPLEEAKIKQVDLDKIVETILEFSLLETSEKDRVISLGVFLPEEQISHDVGETKNELQEPDTNFSNINSENEASLECTCSFGTRLRRIKNAPVTPECNPILETSKIVELKAKMSNLSELVLEINNMALDLNLNKMDLGKESVKLATLKKKEEDTQHLKDLRAGDLTAQSNFDNGLKALSERIEETKQKISKLTDEFHILQTQIYQLKIEKKKLYLEIGEFM